MKRKDQRSMLMLAIIMAFVLGVFWAGPVGAGDLEPAGPPGSTMHTLDEIYEVVVDTNSKVNGGSCEGAPVEKTGQTPTAPIDPAPAGGDGNLEKGVAWPDPRFTDNDGETVTDNLTGLMWAQDVGAGGSKTWSVALTYCNGLDLGGYTDWRLPNVKELQSLIHYGVYNPALPNTAGTDKWVEGDPFSGVESYYYWSSTTHADNPDNAWLVDLHYGNVNFGNKDYNSYVWPVRGGE